MKNNIEEKLKQEKEYFDNMFKKIDKNIKLDEEQRKIILEDEKYIMVIAGAGSGKTTTISAKINYLIEKEKLKDEEILIISFTNKAIQELIQRINKDFRHNVKIMTFHKLGYEIIKNNYKEPPNITSDNTEIIKEYINEKLIKNDIKLKRIKKKYKNYFNKTEKDHTYPKFINLCNTFIKLYKSKGYNENELYRIKINHKKERELIEFLKEIYIYYQKKLKEKKKIDFEDMINHATEIIKNKRTIKIKYKYIIIDEYQDISESRFQLIKTISQRINCKIMVVGDDWQCIYSFASSNINMFIDFKKYMGTCKILKITTTYRNSQELIDIAGSFIQKNKKQIPKKLISNKTINNPITVLKYEKNNQIKKIKQALDYLIKEYGKEKNILILGRYKNDKNRVIDNKEIIEQNNRIIYKNYKTLKIEYMTVHASKGLGYDNVIIINTENKKMGFPSKIKTDRILKQFINKKENIKYEEERRLFYVALTRTKNEVIILSPKKKYSLFVKEIKKNKKVQIKSNIKK